jgi:hypothetical protein
MEKDKWDGGTRGSEGRYTNSNSMLTASVAGMRDVGSESNCIDVLPSGLDSSFDRDAILW